MVAGAGDIGAVAAASGAVGTGTAPLRPAWRELAALLPDVVRLLRDLLADARVPRRAKALALAATAYAAVPDGLLPGRLASAGHRLDEALAVLLAVRYLVVTAGYEVVRERWHGTDAGFALLMLLAGVAE